MMRSQLILVLFASLCFVCMCTGENDTSIRVETSSGVVVGDSVQSKWGPVLHFYGVPYAKPPPRFTHSKPILHQRANMAQQQQQGNGGANGGTLSSRHEYHHHYNPNIKLILKDGQQPATPPPFLHNFPVNTDLQDQQPCPQPSHLVDFKHPAVSHSPESVNEDCLRMNIFLPDTGNLERDVERPEALGMPDKYPILVWIPGDGFSFGDAMHYDASALAAKGEMIVMVVNYRVGVFGFLSTGDDVVPGNAGLSDIISALHWIRENGEEFNGDVHNVTLGGRFSGSMAISALVSSPKFTRSFDTEFPTLASRIILHGGIATSPWVIETNPITPATKLMVMTNCSRSLMTDSILCLRQLQTQTLLQISMKVSEMFRPVIDHNIILRDPMESIYYGIFPEKIQFLIGDNSGAGSLCYQRHVYMKGEVLDKIQDNAVTQEILQDLVQDDLKIFFHVDNVGLASITSHEYLYTPKAEVSSFRDLYTHFCGLLFIRIPTETTARYISRFERNTVYRYELDGQFESDPAYGPFNIPKWLETSIGNEIIFLFPTGEHNMSQAEEMIFKDLTSTYASFVRNGTPLIDAWHPFSEQDKCLMIFTPNGTRASRSTYLDRDIHFWRDSFPKLLNSYLKLLGTSTGNGVGAEKDGKPNEINSEPIIPDSNMCMSFIQHHESNEEPVNFCFVIVIIMVVAAVIAVLVGCVCFYRKYKITALFRSICD